MTEPGTRIGERLQKPPRLLPMPILPRRSGQPEKVVDRNPVLRQGVDYAGKITHVVRLFRPVP